MANWKASQELILAFREISVQLISRHSDDLSFEAGVETPAGLPDFGVLQS